MGTYRFEPTEIEAACGVTAEQVADLLPKVLIRTGPDWLRRVYFPSLVPPALCGAVTRTALGHSEYTFIGLNRLGMPVYGELL